MHSATQPDTIRIPCLFEFWNQLMWELESSGLTVFGAGHRGDFYLIS